jgi:hypothetical protein
MEINKNLSNIIQMSLLALVCTQNEKITKYFRYKFENDYVQTKLTNSIRPKYPNILNINN